MGITEACSKFIGEFLQAFRSSNHSDPRTCNPQMKELKLDDNMVRALVTVFGMESNGRIKKENARRVVENLGLIHESESVEEMEKQNPSGFEVEEDDDDDDDEVAVEKVLDGMEDMEKRSELLKEAFKIFDEDGDGFIGPMELKRVLDCLGLDRGWDMNTIEKMVKVVDLNLDGKVDFGEFELMMA